MRTLFSAILVILTAAACAQSPKATIAKLEKDIPELITSHDIPGLSAAYISNGTLVWVRHYGVSNAATRQPVTDSTIFEAASLSKVVTAYMAIQLVDQGRLNLDTPLSTYLDNNYDVGDDPRLRLVTARRVLSHSAGFPNWRAQEGGKLPINFTPGEKFSYSGEGFVFLARVMEKLTGQPLETYSKQVVFTPLGMQQTSFTWLDSYQTRGAYRHDWLGNMSFRAEYKGANAAASVRTTARDYATFMVALLNGTGLSAKMHTAMFTPQIKVDANKFAEVAWGLGVGLENTAQGKFFWHWGDQGDSKCFMTANLDTKDGIVYFTNSYNGITIADNLLKDALHSTHPAVAWLDYPAYNPTRKLFYEAIEAQGAAKTIERFIAEAAQHPEYKISESDMNSIGYLLLRKKKVDDALIVFKQNTLDFPNSANTWDSLGEAYAVKGDKAAAIQNYQRSLQLDPSNSNAAEQIKKLKE
ncbi:serine hydrolase [Paraflavitalea pollutisoli]|uniref:serine hydrolase n=1 Tax=Paraflavitalea pollutisoli TaxID=3034143 RepID=UPI0023ECAEB8|nr:serine hydrolase [Paraflavitalea sp. H1-2-19X]